ncbi:MAG: methylamine utilization protein [Burkholderiales bacterium]|nr:methylamine utilization protein [Burkholderiales bacterium]
MRTLILSISALFTALPVLAAGIDVHVSDANGKPLADAAVYAEPVNGKVPKGKLATIIDQVDKEFVPLVTVMQTGTAVRFPNKDNIRHHVYSFSPAKVFDLKLYSGTPAEPVVFDKPGQVVLGCNIHDWMIAYALVVDTPWFEKTGADGLAHLPELPPGDYTLKVWHPYQLADAAPVRLKSAAGAETQFKFQIKLAPPPARSRPKNQGSY